MRKQKAREAREELDEVEVDEDGNEIKEEGNGLYVNPEDVSANIKAKMSKEERLELVKVSTLSNLLFFFFMTFSFVLPYRKRMRKLQRTGNSSRSKEARQTRLLRGTKTIS